MHRRSTELIQIQSLILNLDQEVWRRSSRGRSSRWCQQLIHKDWTSMKMMNRWISMMYQECQNSCMQILIHRIRTPLIKVDSLCTLKNISFDQPSFPNLISKRGNPVKSELKTLISVISNRKIVIFETQERPTNKSRMTSTSLKNMNKKFSSFKTSLLICQDRRNYKKLRCTIN